MDCTRRKYNLENETSFILCLQLNQRNSSHTLTLISKNQMIDPQDTTCRLFAASLTDLIGVVHNCQHLMSVHNMPFVRSYSKRVHINICQIDNLQ